MKKANRIWLLLFGVAMLATFSASSAWAAACGDADPSVPVLDRPCSCGDIVDTDTHLNASDPVLTSLCSPVGLFVAGGVNLDVSSAHIRCDTSSGAFTTGLWLIGNGVTIDGGSGIIEGCDIGIYVPTSNNTIESLAVRDGGSVGVFVDFGNNNTLRKIWCDDYDFNGIFVIGDGNLLERNYCQGNGQTGILAIGANTLNHNQGRNNGGQGVVAVPFLFFGAPPQTDRRNYGTANDLKPDCEINFQSATANGKYC